MFEHGTEIYTLKFSVRRVQMVEQALGLGVMELLTRSRGMLPLQALLSCLGFGLQVEDVYVPTKKAMGIAEELLEKEGYPAVNMAVMDALQHDCPFFFQGLS